MEYYANEKWHRKMKSLMPTQCNVQWESGKRVASREISWLSLVSPNSSPCPTDAQPVRGGHHG